MNGILKLLGIIIKINGIRIILGIKYFYEIVYFVALVLLFRVLLEPSAYSGLMKICQLIRTTYAVILIGLGSSGLEGPS